MPKTTAGSLQFVKVFDLIGTKGLCGWSSIDASLGKNLLVRYFHDYYSIDIQ
jgi:hypothetical protein